MAIPLIIDTDPGVDDAFALALAARSPEVDLIGVTTVFGNVGLEQTTSNARRLLALLGHDAPVAKGAEHPRGVHRKRNAGDVHGDDGLSGLSHTLPEATRPLDPRDAVTFMKDLIEHSPDPVTIAAVGPLTNVADLLDSGVTPGRLVVMGGGLEGGNVTERAEFNLWSDPEAAKRVLLAGPTLVTIELTRRCAVYADWLDALTGPLGTTLNSFTRTYRDYYMKHLGRDGMAVHDAVAVAEAIRPGILRTTTHRLDVDDEGALIKGPHPVEVAEEEDGVIEFIRGRVQ